MPENLEVDEKVTTFAHVNETSRDGAEVARWAHNPKAGGSNPPPATKRFRGVAVITLACHARDRGFNSRRNRHSFWLHSSVGRAQD